ncbi:hypothetical protein GUJ93_ZPchr0006g45957 [Zizania palustris]|uniref:Carboxypeptidase n=1 Tax=Zizania palustris TaxID=103762 RepID=A0A8J5VQH0_ZIZPA|nr:hypothetical protein GUJ93_ZPchr0006g45957 [Zizania palustris]
MHCSNDHCKQHVACLEQIRLGYGVLQEASEFAKNDFFITGESYAGLYIPAFASHIHHINKENEDIHINLKGFAIGNGLTDPAIQYKAYTDYALDMHLIEKSDYERINKFIPQCEFAIKLCGTNGKTSCMAWQHTWSAILFSAPIMKHAGAKNYYGVRKECKRRLCYDFSNMDKFFDWMRNLEVGIPTLLEDGINVLIYAGEYELYAIGLGTRGGPLHGMVWPERHCIVS